MPGSISGQQVVSSVMKTTVIILALGILLVASCKKDGSIKPIPADKRFAATDVLVKTRAGFTTEEVFEFINSLNHEVEYVTPDHYVSALPKEQLNDVLAYFEGKPYVDINWPVYGYVHEASQRIMIFPRLYSIRDTSNQHKWLGAIRDLKLSNQGTGFFIHFHVPEGKEKEWVSRFRQYPFIEWADLNYMYTLERL
jgi:hypothetical protein